MPEIAEVETVRNVLKRKVLHKKIINIIVRYKNILEVDEDYFKKIVIGQEIRDIARKGKWLLFDLGDYYLLSHLRMEGKYYIKDSSEAYNKHEHIIFCFADHTDLRYHDTRKFGRMNLVKKSEIVLAFWDGKSKGTKYVISLCKKQNKNIDVYIYDSNKDTYNHL